MLPYTISPPASKPPCIIVLTRLNLSWIAVTAFGSASKELSIIDGTLSTPKPPLVDPVNSFPVLKVPVVCSNFTVDPAVTLSKTIPVAPLPACVSVSPFTTVIFPAVVIVKILPRSKYWSSSI